MNQSDTATIELLLRRTLVRLELYSALFSQSSFNTINSPFGKLPAASHGEAYPPFCN